MFALCVLANMKMILLTMSFNMSRFCIQAAINGYITTAFMEENSIVCFLCYVVLSDSHVRFNK